MSKHRLWSQLRLVAICLALGLCAGIPANGQEDTSGSLKVIVYGASGNVGSRVMTEALNRGHQVTGVSRNPSKLRKRHENLEFVKGDILNAQSVAETVVDYDVIVVSVRGSADGSRAAEQAVQRVAADVVIGVLRDMGGRAPRLIYVGGAGSLEVKPGVIYADTIPKIMLPKSIEQEIEGHILTLEFLRTVSDVKWTYISPAKSFKKGKRTGKFRIGGDQMLLDEKGKSKISMEDFAVALVDEAENAANVGKRISIAY